MMVKSNDVGVDAVFEAGKTYAIRYKEPGTFEEAKNYFTDFSATLIDLGNGKEYSSYKIENLPSILAAKQINAGTGSTTGTNMAPAVVVPAAAAMSTTTADAAVKEDPVKRLKFWWLMANENERKQFSAWMKTATESFAPEPAKTPATSKPEEEMKIKP